MQTNDSYGKKRKKRDMSLVVDFRWVEGGFLQERVNSRLLQRVKETASWEGAINKMGEKGKKVRSNSLENVRRDGVKGAGGPSSGGHQANTWLGDKGVKEENEGDEEEVGVSVVIEDWLVKEESLCHLSYLWSSRRSGSVEGWKRDSRDQGGWKR